MKNKNWFWGLLFLLAAATLIANQLGLLSNFNIYSLIIAIFLIPIIVSCTIHRHFFGVFIPLGILSIIFRNELGIPTELSTLVILGAATLVSIGFHILFHKHNPNHHWDKFHKNEINKHENFQTIVDEPDSNIVECHVRFGSSVKYVNSNSLQKATLSCSFGALKVYFDNAKLSNDGANINVDVSFGAIEMYIPKEWRIIDNVNVSLGGIDEKNRKTVSDGPSVTLTGNVNLAGVEITYI